MRLLALCWVLVDLALIVTVWLRLAKPNGVPARVAFWVVFGAAVLVAPARLLQGFLLESLGLNPAVSVGGAHGALLAAMGILAPIEQTMLVLIVWPVHRSSHLLRMKAAVTAGILVALGFSTIDGGWMLFTGDQWSVLVRALVRSCHTVGACIIWAAAASYDQNHRKHWFPLAWLGAVVVQGFGNHVALGHSPGFVIPALPLLLVLVTGTASVLRNGSTAELKPRPQSHSDTDEKSPRGVLSTARRLSRVSHLPEPPTIQQIRVAWKHEHRPALLHWIAAGALICIGTLFVAVAMAVLTSHWLAVDLSRIDDGESSATGPMLFLGAFVIGAFPVSGYLVALASAADSVFEPGMAALVAIVIVTALLSVAAPVGVIFAFAAAPLAFGLACVGAWFGLKR